MTALEAKMQQPLPNPGKGFKVREFLGGGNWKSAYRASSIFNLSDVALLFFHDDQDRTVLIRDVGNLLRANNHIYSDYLAKFYGLQEGDDGRFFIVEELLARPLDRISPLNDLFQFVQIARDLSRGLRCLHENNLVHRDLKLDNCGLDHHRHAKIFDLGSVTSDGGEVRGTLLTRAPEIFSDLQAKSDMASDVWSLGATLFALRVGEYPFVTSSEIQERQFINNDVRAGRISTQEGDRRKSSLLDKIKSRILAPNASSELDGKIHSSLRAAAERVLRSMLEFDREKRSKIGPIEERWSNLADELGSLTLQDKDLTKWEKIEQYVHRARQRDLILTSKQIDRIIEDYHHDRKEQRDVEFEKALSDVKEMAASRRSA